MKRQLFVSFALFPFALTAQINFDIYSFTLPEKYTKQAVEKSLVIAAPDDKLSILLIPVKESTNAHFTEFENDWNLFVASKYTVLGFHNRKTTDFNNGWKMTTGQSKVQQGEQMMWIQIRNFIKNKKKATLVFFAVDDKQQTNIQQFIYGLSLSDAAVVTNNTNPVNNQPNINNTNLTENKGIEVWMGVKSGAFNMSNDYYSGNYYDLSKNRMSYIVTYPDGNYTAREMPKEGLLYFNINSPDASAYTWGKYTKTSKGIYIKSSFEDKNLAYLTKDKLQEPGWVNPYYKCKPVDGLKPDGSWSYIPNSEKDPYYDEPGCRQVIYFTKDGKFTDRGVFISDCRYPDKYPEDAPGEGTYEIKKFSLILKYNDGRTVYKSFTGALANDPFSQNDVLYIGRIAFFKRKK